MAGFAAILPLKVGAICSQHNTEKSEWSKQENSVLTSPEMHMASVYISSAFNLMNL